MVAVRARVARVIDGTAAVIRPHVPPGSPTRRALEGFRRLLPRQAPSDPIGRAIYEFARGRPDAFFVQVGANDAVQRDQLREEVLARRWRGILVEPVPYVFERLRQNCGDEDRLILENVAIADHDGSQELFYLPQSTDQGLPQWYDALASFRREVVVKHREYIPDIEDRVASMDVPCLTFSSLCNRHRVQHIDFVQIDTEGYDFEVIKLIDFDRYRPVLLMFEHHHLAPTDRTACNAYLRAHGFTGLSHSLDTLCIRPSELTRRDRHLTDVWSTLCEMPYVEVL